MDEICRSSLIFFYVCYYICVLLYKTYVYKKLMTVQCIKKNKEKLYKYTTKNKYCVL